MNWRVQLDGTRWDGPRIDKGGGGALQRVVNACVRAQPRNCNSSKSRVFHSIVSTGGVPRLKNVSRLYSSVRLNPSVCTPGVKYKYFPQAIQKRFRHECVPCESGSNSPGPHTGIIVPSRSPFQSYFFRFGIYCSADGKPKSTPVIILRIGLSIPYRSVGCRVQAKVIKKLFGNYEQGYLAYQK